MTINLPVCGQCVFFHEVQHKDKDGNAVGTGAGFCHAEPPVLHLIPSQSKVAMGAGGVEINPRNYRRAVSAGDAFCRHFVPISEFMSSEKSHCDGNCGSCDAARPEIE